MTSGSEAFLSPNRWALNEATFISEKRGLKAKNLKMSNAMFTTNWQIFPFPLSLPTCSHAAVCAKATARAVQSLGTPKDWTRLCRRLISKYSVVKGRRWFAVKTKGNVSDIRQVFFFCSFLAHNNYVTFCDCSQKVNKSKIVTCSGFFFVEEKHQNRKHFFFY